MPLTASHIALLACPVCGEELRSGEGRLVCPASHSFDIARGGHVQLTRRPIRHRGDTREMVQARQRVHAAGVLAPVVNAVAAAVAAHRGTQIEPRPGGVLVEVGAGPGSYLATLLAAGLGQIALALDASREAARAASRVHDAVGSVVCDATEGLPIRDQVADVVLCLFAPRNPGEFRRILAADGALVIAYPQPGHLADLRTDLDLLDVKPHKQASVAQALQPAFDLAARTVIDEGTAASPALLVDLVMMGPNAFHTDAATVAGQVAQISNRPLRMQVAVETWLPRPG